jgi:hypothetical protein
VQRPDGGYTLVNSITAADGSYRVGGRFDYDARWNVIEAHGAGLDEGVPVAIKMTRRGKRVEINVTGRGKPYRSDSNCDPSCLMDLAPSISTMFVITRHYDFARGGKQDFMWAGHALTRRQSLSDDRVQLSYLGESTIARDGRPPLALRHFTFDETIPRPSGPPLVMAMEISRIEFGGTAGGPGNQRPEKVPIVPVTRRMRKLPASLTRRAIVSIVPSRLMRRIRRVNTRRRTGARLRRCRAALERRAPR